MSNQQILEGTTEEIIALLHGSAFADRQLRVVVVPQEPEDFSDSLPDPPDTIRDLETKAMIQKKNKPVTPSLSHQQGGTAVSEQVQTQGATPQLIDEQFINEEERADEEVWLAKFAATPDDKLQKLVQKVRASIQDGKTRPLDFENR